jgi:hypothetical protein
MDEKKNAIVEWLVNFAQMDLERLGPGDRAKVEVEAGEYLFPDADERLIAANKKELFKYKLPRTITSDGVYAAPSKEFKWINTLPSRGTPEYWSMVIDCQKAIHDHLKNIVKFHGAQSISPAICIFLVKEEFEIKVLPIANDHADYVVIKLNRALEGLPANSLQTCQSCGRIFFNSSRRSMKYCSTKCLWRFNTRKRRAADHEVHERLQLDRRLKLNVKLEVAPNVKIKGRKTKDKTVDE